MDGTPPGSAAVSSGNTGNALPADGKASPLGERLVSNARPGMRTESSPNAASTPRGPRAKVLVRTAHGWVRERREIGR